MAKAVKEVAEAVESAAKVVSEAVESVVEPSKFEAVVDSNKSGSKKFIIFAVAVIAGVFLYRRWKLNHDQIESRIIETEAVF